MCNLSDEKPDQSTIPILPLLAQSIHHFVLMWLKRTRCESVTASLQMGLFVVMLHSVSVLVLPNLTVVQMVAFENEYCQMPPRQLRDHNAIPTRYALLRSELEMHDFVFANHDCSAI